MTAEVAVLNRSAAALAADSAVTVGPGKVYDTINKLFTLSKYHPVGVMIFNNAEFMDLPWETIIKAFRSSLGDDEHETIQDYALAFKDYLASTIIASDDAKKRHWANVYSSLCRSIGSMFIRRAVEEDSSTRGALHQILYPLVTQFIKQRESNPPHSLTGKITIAEVRLELGKEIDAINNGIWKGHYRLSLTAKAKELLLRALVAQIRSSVRSNDFSGIVISGFGAKEMFPSLVEMHIDGAYALKPKIIFEELVDVGRNPGSPYAYLKGFAQTDMVERFMYGREVQVFEQFMRRYSSNMLKSAIKEIVSHTASRRTPGARAKLIKDLNKKVPGWVGSFTDSVNQQCHSRYAGPLLDTVGGLPKPEMASLAEALVNLTSVKRKMSADAETVGGPIDVALISKGDGFVWVRRKHYFDIAMNTSFAPNYFRK